MVKRNCLSDIPIATDNGRKEVLQNLDDVGNMLKDKIRMLSSALYLDNLSQRQFEYLDKVILPIVLKAKQLRDKTK